MLTVPIEASTAAANGPARILVIGRSENVLSEAVTILRDKGYAAGATNEFDRTLDLQISTRNPAMVFVQGYAGIPGLIAEQAAAALCDGTTGPGASVTYDARSRSIGISLGGPQRVTVIAWWATSFVPPEPKSTSLIILDEELPTGSHTIAIPDEVPARASFATVSIGPSVQAFVVGPMPAGTTLARLAGVEVPASVAERLALPEPQCLRRA
jgi:hypothetical protein